MTAATIIATIIGSVFGANAGSHKRAAEAHDSFYNALKAEGLDSVDVRQVYDYALDTNKITKDEYKRGLNIIDQMEKYTNGELEWADLSKYYLHSVKTNKDARNFYETMTKVIPDFAGCLLYTSPSPRD